MPTMNILVGALPLQVVEECNNYLAVFRRPVYHTPKSFLSFLDTYRSLYDQRLSSVCLEESRVRSGLEKMQQVCRLARSPLYRLSKALGYRSRLLILLGVRCDHPAGCGGCGGP